MSSDRTAGVCWKQQFATTATSTWRNEGAATTRKNACNRETMMKIGAATAFAMAQAALAREHASRRSADAANNTADRAVRCNRNTVTNSLSNSFDRKWKKGA